MTCISFYVFNEKMYTKYFEHSINYVKSIEIW